MEVKKIVRLDQYDNAWYQPGSFLKRSAWYLVNLFIFKSSFPYPQALRRFLLRSFGAIVGKNVGLKPNVNIKYPWFLEIADNVWIGEKVWIDNLDRVKIGSHVCISQGAYLLTGNHDYKKESFDLMIAPITIENGVWVGAKAVICPGVALGTHSVVTAGSVVKTDTEPYSIYQGNPAVAVGQRIIK